MSSAIRRGFMCSLTVWPSSVLNDQLACPSVPFQEMAGICSSVWASVSLKLGCHLGWATVEDAINAPFLDEFRIRV